MAGHFRPSSSGGLGALSLGTLRLGALPLEAFVSSDFIFRFERRCFLLCGQVESVQRRVGVGNIGLLRCAQVAFTGCWRVWLCFFKNLPRYCMVCVVFF